MKTIFSIFWMIILPCSVFAQSSCDGLVQGYALKKAKQPMGMIHFSSKSGGALSYFGAVHSTDFSDSQFQKIKASWDAASPTIACYEGPDRGILATDTLSVQKLGESGYLRFLANAARVEAKSLEPSPVDLYGYLNTKFDAEKVDLFFILGEVARLRTRKHLDQSQLSVEVEQLLKKMAALSKKDLSVSSLQQLETAFKKHWGNKLEWWQAPQEWFDPGKTDQDTGGLFTNEINKASSHYRDLYSYQLLARYTNKGEKVFAVIGKDHLPAQSEALKCAIK